MGQQASSQYLSVPYETQISPSISYGSQIQIHGTATGDRFEINLVSSRGDVVLHVNPRINDRQLVLNSAPGGNWGQEERQPLHISPGEQFTLIIMVTEQDFKIVINNQHAADFNHRMPFYAAETVSIKGDMNLTNFQVYPGVGGRNGQPWHFAMETAVPINICPGRVLTVNGRSNQNASRFEINFLTGTHDGADILFHFNPRFDQREAIRTSCQSGAWGDEEKQGGFPLRSGEDFEIQIICFPEYYQINSKGQPWFTFQHRASCQAVRALQVKGDVAISNVRVM